jgi:hypothetical protein
MKLYLAGPMRGIPQFNFPAFHEAAAKLRARGHEVFSPAEKDVEMYGPDIAQGNLFGDEEKAARDHGFNLREALLADLEFICRYADGIVMLPGWLNSRGAQAERRVAMALDLKIFDMRDFL